MSYTQFVFYANTPFVNALKTIHFNSNIERDKFFDTKMNSLEILKYGDSKFNMVRDRLIVNVHWDHDRGPLTPSSPITENNNYKDMIGVNYCYFYDSNINERMYCQVVKTEYVNNQVTKFYLSVDILMTYFQGDFTDNIGNVHIKRQHLENSVYDKNKYYLASRDKLRVSSPRIIHQKFAPLGMSETQDKEGKTVYKPDPKERMFIVFQSSVDLASKFGDIDEPLMSTSIGSFYDSVVSPVSLYVLRMNDALDLFKALKDYPWISQNIKNITMIPEDFIDETDLKSINAQEPLSPLLKVKTFKNGTVSNIKKQFRDNIVYMFEEINTIFSSYTSITDILINEPHLYNSGYIKIYMSNWSGSSVELLPEKLIGNKQNLKFQVQSIIGYDNKIAIIPTRYNSNGENMETTDGNNKLIGPHRGDYLNCALWFASWDTLPIMIDNYKLSLSNSAYSRKLTEESMIGYQFNNMISGGSDEYSSVESAMRVGGTLFGGSMNAIASGASSGGVVGAGVAFAGNTLFNGFNQYMSEKQYYRQQQATENQMKLNSPTITNQTLGNSFSYKNSSFGVSVKIFSVDPEELINAYKYHKNIGYEWNRFEKPNSITSMSHVNYLEIDGEWYLENIPTEFMKMAKDMFKQGVSFYHNPERLLNPFNDDILKNKRIK